MKSHMIELRKHLDFTDILGEKRIVTVGVGPERDALLLTVDPQDKNVPFGRDEQPGWALFPRLMIRHPYPATVIHLNITYAQCLNLLDVEAAFPIIQPLADDRILLVSARSEFREGDPEKNAVIYDRHGQVINRMVFGDGIEVVQASRDQRIWVSYFDEGIFGSHGWPGLAMAQYGLVCYDTDGQIIWHYQAHREFGMMADCYALNVTDNAVWICYYTDFPIVKITTDGKVQGWGNSYIGANVLTTDDQRVLLYGGYDEEKTRCVVQTIEGDTLVSPQLLDLRLPNGKSLKDARVIGRDSILHAFVGKCWYQFDLRDLPSL